MMGESRQKGRGSSPAMGVGDLMGETGCRGERALRPHAVLRVSTAPIWRGTATLVRLVLVARLPLGTPLRLVWPRSPRNQRH